MISVESKIHTQTNIYTYIHTHKATKNAKFMERPFKKSPRHSLPEGIRSTSTKKTFQKHVNMMKHLQSFGLRRKTAPNRVKLRELFVLCSLWSVAAAAVSGGAGRHPAAIGSHPTATHRSHRPADGIGRAAELGLWLILFIFSILFASNIHNVKFEFVILIFPDIVQYSEMILSVILKFFR